MCWELSANNKSTMSPVWDKQHHSFVICLRQYVSVLCLNVNEVLLIWCCIHVNHKPATSASGTKWVTSNRTVVTSWHGNAYYVLALCDRNSPHKGPSVRRFDVSFTAILSEQFSKHSDCQRFETPWRSCKLTVSTGQIGDPSILDFFLVITISRWLSAILHWCKTEFMH